MDILRREKVLGGLVQAEQTAIERYASALEGVREPTTVAELRRLESEHERALAAHPAALAAHGRDGPS
jgi:hypothetical protein